MTRSPPPVWRTRRSVLAAAGVAGLTATAGCLDAVLGSSPQAIEPEEPSEPRRGTPGEFYTLLERNDLQVEALTRDGDHLILEYYSNAETEEESIEEIGVVVQVFNAIIVAHGTDLELFIAEIRNPFDGQAHGWGLEPWLLEAYNEGEADEMAVFGSILGSRVDGDGEQLGSTPIEPVEDGDGIAEPDEE
ncbi:hypothetical protein [Natronobiforma cellulositropha]|uniref:hypothetical protein n=1 Tax=Natronobiforma cellulositropha TaxID=1679076 RepID=UPI0021D5BCA0|nr:hypothetical protein [Natronobiforma cellulositropha]